MWGIGFTNLKMLLATIPSFEHTEDKPKDEKETYSEGIGEGLENFL